MDRAVDLTMDEEPIAFSGGPLDRADSLRRDAAWLAGRLQDESTRLLPVWRLSVLVREGRDPRLAWATPAILASREDDEAPEEDSPEPVFLGLEPILEVEHA